MHVRIPPCDTLGHRADAWNVQKPDYTCELRTLTRGDTFILRLLTLPQDDGSGGGELFAEALWQPDRPMTSVGCCTLLCVPRIMSYSDCCVVQSLSRLRQQWHPLGGSSTFASNAVRLMLAAGKWCGLQCFRDFVI